MTFINTSIKFLIKWMILFIPLNLFGQYTGTGSVTQGLATTVSSSIYSCPNGRVPGIGSIKASDNTIWTVPAEVNFTNASFPFASNLNNPCTGANYGNASEALAKLNGSDIINIDSNGDLITAFIFADNYFEMYINGTSIGKDNVPYTQFNSNIIRFRVKQPFTVAMLLVDWEENLGLGSENNNGFQYHAGDGGMVAVFKDSTNNIIATTGSDWKAQTFYTSPIIDLSCPTENGTLRLSNNCSTQDSNIGANYYGLHWAKPANWMNSSFDDTSWPNATTYTNASIGVDNKPAYTNFIDIFDNPANDANFIWSTNVILDNEVIVRAKIGKSTSTTELKQLNQGIDIYPNPANNEIRLSIDNTINVKDIREISIYNSFGEKVFESDKYIDMINTGNFPNGIYYLKIDTSNILVTLKLVIQ